MSAATPWQIDYAGHSFTDDDLTGADLVAIQVLVNDGWNSANPLAGPWHCFVTTAVVLGRMLQRDPELLLEELRTIPADNVPVPQPRELRAVEVA